MRSKKIPFQNRERRRLTLTASGKWYIALTIGLGTVALSSGNNLIYLTESFLLGGLILSGVLSEHALRNIAVRWIQNPCHALTPNQDYIEVTNRSRLPVFCIYFRIWNETQEPHHIFIGWIQGKEQFRIPFRWQPERRGWHQGKGYIISTAFPFGFATKLRYIPAPYRRLVWPAVQQHHIPIVALSQQKNLQGKSDAHEGVGISPHLREGELREWTWDDDASEIIWNRSFNSTVWKVRTRGTGASGRQIYLDLNKVPAELWESTMEQLTYLLTSDPASQLTLQDQKTIHRFMNQKDALDYLATATFSNVETKHARA